MPVVDVVSEAERVGAREQRLHGALLHPHVSLTAFISSASVTIVPANPSSSRSSPVSWARLSVAGTCVDRRDDEVGGHDRAGAGGDRRPEGRELDLQQLLARRRDDGQSEV